MRKFFKKYMKTTLGKKLALFYLIIIGVSFLFLETAGYNYIYVKVQAETDSYLQQVNYAFRAQKNTNFIEHSVFIKDKAFVKQRTDYYFNILMTLFFLMAGLVGLFFIAIYVFNVLPLRKLREGVKDFSISRENKPILIRSNDEYGELADTLNVIGDELSKFDEYQRKFISNISHDFRSPLTSIGAMCKPWQMELFHRRNKKNI